MVLGFATGVVIFPFTENSFDAELLLLLNACIRVADVMKFTFVSPMPVHNVCRICKIIKE